MYDTGEYIGADHYRVAITRDGPGWVARTYGRYLPDDGVEARSATLAGVKQEADRQQLEAGLPAGFRGFSSWLYEYNLGPSSDGKLEAFRQAGLALHQAEADRAERGHEAAADLAAAYNATLDEIADILGLCCSEEAAELLNDQGPQLIGFSRCPHQKEQQNREPLAVRAAWQIRGLADSARSKLQEARERRRVR